MNPTCSLRLLERVHPPRVGGVLACWLGVGCGVGPAASTVTSHPSGSPAAVTPGAVLLVADLACDDPFERFADADGDGVGDAAVSVMVCEEVEGFVADAGDCDDLRVDVSPLASETCGNGLDENCDGVDEACAPPDLRADSVIAVRDAAEDSFGFSVVGGLIQSDRSGFIAAVGAPDTESSPGANDDAGMIYALGTLDAQAPGEEVAFADVLTGTVTGTENTAVGVAMARASTGNDGVFDRLYVGTGGALDIGGVVATCAVFWWDEGIPVSGGFTDGLVSHIPCDTGVDPLVRDNGVESVAGGFWEPGVHVLAAARVRAEQVWVLPSPDSSSGDAMASWGTRLNDVDDEDLGEQLAWADFDGDGLDDLVATTPTRGTYANDGGGFDILTGDELAAMGEGSEFDARAFGMGVGLSDPDQNTGFKLAVGDLTGDGQPEVMLGAFEEDSVIPASVTVVHVGDMEAFAGTRPALESLPGDAAYTQIASDQFFDLYSYGLAYVPEDTASSAGLLVGAPGWDSGADPAVLDGRLYVYAASADWFDSTSHDATAAARVVLDTDVSGEGFGIGLSDAEDVNSDGQRDVLITTIGIASPSSRVLLLTNTGL